jgi:hypothetical protein
MRVKLHDFMENFQWGDAFYRPLLYKMNKGNTKFGIVAKYTVTKAFDRDVGIIAMHIGDMLWKISGYFIISSDLDLANINLNYTCHTCSHDSYHLCYNPSNAD